MIILLFAHIVMGYTTQYNYHNYHKINFKIFISISHFTIQRVAS